MGFLICSQKAMQITGYELLCSTKEYKIYINQMDKGIKCDMHIDKDETHVFFGKIYPSEEKASKFISAHLKKKGKIQDVDGEFIYIDIQKSGELTIFTDREGIIPIYYHIAEDKNVAITTEESLLFGNFQVQDIDKVSINDFLRFGTLLGDRTFSNNVKLIEGGTKWQYVNGHIKKERYHLFRFNEKKSIKNISSLIENVSEAYLSAIKKRLSEQDVKDTSLFMSGGIDSRYLLAMINKLYEHERIHAYTFGQPCSEEVDVARKCSLINNNPFSWIKVEPKDFISNAGMYANLTCGADMFPQSYIIEVIHSIKQSKFCTGFSLDALIGGTFLNEDSINSNKKLSEFIPNNLKLIKMNALSDKILRKICKEDNYEELFDVKDQHLINVAKEYDEYELCDSIQPFAINNRAKRLVLMREITPAKYKDYLCFSMDKHFLEAVSLIPSGIRNNHNFYQQLFMKSAPEYTDIIYNNTTLPVSADISLWKSGSDCEFKRELLFQKLMADNTNNGRKVYYPHYYSDFDGYSRYDEEWLKLFENTILLKDAFINTLWFDQKEIENLYNEHISGLKNYRKELIYLASLEIFLSNFLKK